MVFAVVTGRVVLDHTGLSKEMPVLISDLGPVLPLIDYFLTQTRSLSWQEKMIRAAKLFFEYLEVNVSQDVEEWKLFRNFAIALRVGTVDAKTGDDPSGLYWRARGIPIANDNIALLSDFFDWLGRGENSRALKFNPQYQGSRHEQRLDEQAYAYRRNKAFLGHTWSASPTRLGKVIRGMRAPKVFSDRPPSFPEDKLDELLFKGFKVAGQHNFRDMAITCLLIGGGLRVSEPFHLFFSDVQPRWDDPSIAFVSVHHPELGLAPNDWRNASGKRGSRLDYLASEFGMLPRHLIRGKLHAGWKNPALDKHWYMQVHWFPKQKYGTLFLDIWKRYLEQVALVERNSPYAWVNLSRGKVGEMYTVSSYLKSLQAAVERIGLIYGKNFGTTSHGPRHAYGQRARIGGVNEIILQRAMHHCAPESQLVYTQPQLSEISGELEKAAQALDQKKLTPHERISPFEEMQ